jgi:hypothetical protein
MPGFILLNNPQLWPVEEADMAGWRRDIRALARGESRPIRWSTGARQAGISAGDPVVLMQTGAEGGVVSIGTSLGEIYHDQHWDGSGREAPYIEVEFLGWAGDDPLPRDVLRAELGHLQWPPQSSGVQLSDGDMDRVLELWRDHTGSDPLQTTSRRGQRARTDAAHNRAVELRAMAVTREAMRSLGWTAIEDRSATQPFDFEATSPEGRIRVEVKGLSGYGTTVELTHREVESAREHLTALAVVRGIDVERAPNGSAVGRGGELSWENPWVPHDGQLEPVRFRYQAP